ncbi:hypothetical protein AWM70_17120 [Paenibacillus yonginensis]|uniref:Uncharacterized protein n=1 Tax=Paenibacillus yonginensis TaxID=1462996 RepID=A0A1B1N3S2_9BACL|nr:hypothetical protein [Paenibacillus yonginensis]ANS76091.1 hypothetical protein AWM70_17120 [Paenibacillus yonginensis]
MQVAIDNIEVLTIEDDFKKLDEWWTGATAKIYKENRLIYNVEIDSNIFYNGYELIIYENINNISRININTKGKEESIEETKILLGQYLEGFIPISQKIADYFYGNMKDEHWTEFTDLLEGIKWIISSLEFIQVLSNSTATSYSNLADEITARVTELDQALQNNEMVLIGDLVNYDLIPLIEKIKLFV